MIAFDPFVANLIKTRARRQTDGQLIALTRHSAKSNVASKIPVHASGSAQGCLQNGTFLQ